MDRQGGPIAAWELLGPPKAANGVLAVAAGFTGRGACNRTLQDSTDPYQLPTEVVLSLTDGSRTLSPGQSEQISLSVRITEKPNATGSRVSLANKAWAAGVAEFRLQPPGEPGDVRLRVSAASFVREVRLAVLPEMRPMIGVGIVEGVLDLTRRGKLPLGAMPAGAAFESELSGLKVCVIVQTFVPATAPQGANDRVTVQASFDYTNASPSLGGTFVLADVTTVSNVALELKKEVRNVTQGGAFGINNQAKSGETVEYRITYTNNGDAPVRSMTVNDTTPGYTSFVSATTGATPATLTACAKNTPANALPAAAVPCAAAQPIGGTGPIEWRFVGSVDPGGTGTVLFQVKVD